LSLNDWTWLPTPEKHSGDNFITFLQQKEGYFFLCFPTESEVDRWEVTVVNPINQEGFHTMKLKAQNVEALIQVLEDSVDKWKTLNFQFELFCADWYLEQVDWPEILDDEELGEWVFTTNGFLIDRITGSRFRYVHKHNSMSYTAYLKDNRPVEASSLESLVRALLPQCPRTDSGRLASTSL
jgi:hypothetical protein